MPSVRTPLLATCALLAAGALTSCGSGSTATTGAGSGGDAGEPVTVTNCGTEVTVDSPPERIVTIKSTPTELVLALGLGERIVGTAFLDGPVPEELAPEDALTEISDQAPGQEAVLELEPDLVFAGWESNLAADTAGERDVLADLGVATYVSPSACQSEGAPEQMTYDLLFDHFTEAGDLLGAQEAAAELVAEQRAELDDLGRLAEEPTALWWSSGTDTPFVGGGTGAPQMVMERVGLANIAADVDQTWTSLGWEAVVDADPDVLVLVDADWNSAAQKIEHLESHPATRELSAVKAGRYLTVPFPAGEAGVRSVSAAAGLLAQAEELGLDVTAVGGGD